MHVISLYNIKGGVGKTASCVNLAWLAAKDGYKTLVWDLDPQGAASYYYKAKPAVKGSVKKIIEHELELKDATFHTQYPLLDIIPADMSARKLDVVLDVAHGTKKQFKSLLKSIAGLYDFIFIDCPPGVSNIADNIFNVSDIVLMPVVPTTLSIRTYEQVKQYFQEKEIDDKILACFFSMVDNRKKMHIDTMEQLNEDMRFFEHYIPFLSEIEKMGIRLSPVPASAPTGFGATCYRALWDEIKDSVE